MKTYTIYFEVKLAPGVTYNRYVTVNARNKFFAVIKARIETEIFTPLCVVEVTEEKE